VWAGGTLGGVRTDVNTAVNLRFAYNSANCDLQLHQLATLDGLSTQELAYSCLLNVRCFHVEIYISESFCMWCPMYRKIGKLSRMY
jgi:hypothetical protein